MGVKSARILTRGLREGKSLLLFFAGESEVSFGYGPLCIAQITTSKCDFLT